MISIDACSSNALTIPSDSETIASLRPPESNDTFIVSLNEVCILGDGWMTRTIAPVVGSRSIRASVGMIVVGNLNESNSELRSFRVGSVEFFAADSSLSTPPAWVLSLEVNPSRR